MLVETDCFPLLNDAEQRKLVFVPKWIRVLGQVQSRSQ